MFAFVFYNQLFIMNQIKKLLYSDINPILKLPSTSHNIIQKEDDKNFCDTNVCCRFMQLWLSSRGTGMLLGQA